MAAALGILGGAGAAGGAAGMGAKATMGEMAGIGKGMTTGNPFNGTGMFKSFGQFGQGGRSGYDAGGMIGQAVASGIGGKGGRAAGDLSVGMTFAPSKGDLAMGLSQMQPDPMYNLLSMLNQQAPQRQMMGFRNPNFQNMIYGRR